jgi:adenosine deaminase
VRPLEDLDLEDRIRRMPKAEMHLHFEGAFRWETIRELHSQGATLPDSPPWLALAQPFPDFSDFRDVFKAVVQPTTGTPEIIERHAFEVIEDLAVQNVRYAELIVSHNFHSARGLAHHEVWAAIARGRERAMARHPIDVRLILGLARHRPPATVLADFEAVAAFALDTGWLAGIELHSDERLGANFAFADTYRRASDLGLKLRAHAGEICGAGNVRDAVLECGVTQISHGVRALEDAGLVRDLARQGVVFHVCPTSNLLLGCASSYREHQLRALCDAGLRCSVNSDDPLLFGSDVLNEFRVLVRNMGFTVPEVAEIAKTGFRASLLDARRVAELCAEVDTTLRGNVTS